MYDTEKRIELVKKRMHEYHRRQERRTVCRLSVLCTLLFLSLVGAMGIMQNKPINVTGMYGTSGLPRRGFPPRTLSPRPRSASAMPGCSGWAANTGR